MLELAENRPQELWKKAAAVPKTRGINRSSQRNKIIRTVPCYAHSFGRFRTTSSPRAFGQSARPVHVLGSDSREAAKGGFGRGSCVSDKLVSLSGVSVPGLMTMAAYSDNQTAPRHSWSC